jgi:hypothetical protein
MSCRRCINFGGFDSFIKLIVRIKDLFQQSSRSPYNYNIRQVKNDDTGFSLLFPSDKNSVKTIHPQMSSIKNRCEERIVSRREWWKSQNMNNFN